MWCSTGVWLALLSVSLVGCVELEVPRAPLRVQAEAPVSIRDYPLDHTLRLNQVQLKATHNSYHQRPTLIFAPSHDYSQPSLDTQLEYLGVRGFELDVHAGDAGEIAVYHLGPIDTRSSCRTLSSCLTTIRRWSDRHRQHVPIVIWIEVKNVGFGAYLNDLASIDTTIRQVFDEEQLITPDAVQAGYASPRARVQAEGWPTLAETRGRLLFVLLNRSLSERYTNGYRGLAGRAMFAVASPDQYEQPWALVTKFDDPRESEAILRAVRGGLLVATNTCGAGQDDEECDGRLAAALANGPQTLHDDFPESVHARRYWLNVPDASPARCNPITAPPECTSSALE